LLLVVLAAGCGEKESEASGGAGDSGAGKVVPVAMKDILFVPEKVTARVGQSVRWINRDDVQHTVKATKGADFESKTISKGDTYSAKLTKAGTIDYVCTIHPSQRGTITVAAQ
jgi:plastocyanin